MFQNPATLIYLTQGKFCIVDTDQLVPLSKFNWRAVHSNANWYAKATIYKPAGNIEITMHRFIARTHKPLVTHHKNHNSLDNRRSNLVNMDKRDHSKYHTGNNIRVFYG